MIRFK